MTGKPFEYRKEHIKLFLKLCKERDEGASELNRVTIGRAMKEAFPEFTAKETSVYQFMYNQVQEGREPELPDAWDEYPVQRPEVTFPYEKRVICLSDIHAPQHDVDLIRKAGKVCQALEIDTAVFNGDTLDNAYKGHAGARSVLSAPFGMGIHAMARILDFLAEHGVKKFVLLPGNHDDKMWRDTDQELHFEDWIKAKVWPLCERQDVEWITSNRYYAIMEPHTPKADWQTHKSFVAQNFPWRFTHPKNYSKAQVSCAQELAGIYLSHVMVGHIHHLTYGQHMSGLMYACEAGTFQLNELVGYKNERDSRHPAWHPGFHTITHGVPRPWSKKNPQEWWDEQLA